MIPRAALVLGMAASGEAAAAALERRGARVVRVDRKLGNEDDVSLLDGIDVVVKSPGVPGAHGLVEAARGRGIPVWSEIELGWRLLPGNPVVGITGTKGKTTTARLLAAMFDAAGVPAVLAGNEQRPLAEVAGEVDAGTWIVCELSSFQLEDVHELACRIAVLLNLEPDHLDRYQSFDDYVAAKLRIFERCGTAVVPAKVLNEVQFEPGTKLTRFSSGDPLPAQPALPGVHNRENAAAAVAAARAALLAEDAIAHALATFSGVPHRLELIAEYGGVRFVNDSKATNTVAARTALRAFDAPLKLILGGSLKGESFADLAGDIAARGEVEVLLIGAASDELAAALDAAGVGYRRVGTLAVAVETASRGARPGDVVLLSPACASYDQFENFARRGEEFRRLVQNLGG